MSVVDSAEFDRTRPGYPIACNQYRIGNDSMPGRQHLVGSCGARGHPMPCVTIACEITSRSGPFTDIGLWQDTVPVVGMGVTDQDMRVTHSRIAPVKGVKCRGFKGGDVGMADSFNAVAEGCAPPQ